MKVIVAEILPCLFQTLKQLFLTLACTFIHFSVMPLPTNFQLDSSLGFVVAKKAVQYVDS